MLKANDLHLRKKEKQQWRPREELPRHAALEEHAAHTAHTSCMGPFHDEYESGFITKNKSATSLGTCASQILVLSDPGIFFVTAHISQLPFFHFEV